MSKHPAVAPACCALATAAVVLAFQLPFLRWDPGIYDEGLIALGAEQVLKGHWPAADFYSPYPPAAFAVLALFYKVVGVGIFAERMFSSGLVVLACALGTALIVGCTTTGHRVRSATLAVGVMAAAGPCLCLVWVSPSVSGALTMLLIAALLLRAGSSSRSRVVAAAVGGALGCAALWRVDFALCGALGAALCWLAPPGEHAPLPMSERLYGVAIMAGCASLVALPVFGALVARGGARAFRSLFVWPFIGTYHATLPWPSLWAPPTPGSDTSGAWARTLGRLSPWPFYFPAFAGVLALWRSRAAAMSPEERQVGLWLVITGAGLSIYALGRSDYLHLLPLLMLSLLLLGLCAQGILGEHHVGWSRWVVAPLTLVALVALVAPHLARFAQARTEASAHVAMQLPRGRGMLVRPEAELRYEALERELGHVGGPIYSGASRHDVYMGNDILLYFLAEKDPATYYWCIDAAVTTTSAVQKEMIREVASKQVQRVVRMTNPVVLDAHPVTSPSSSILDEAIERRFRLTNTFGPYELRTLDAAH